MIASSLMEVVSFNGWLLSVRFIFVSGCFLLKIIVSDLVVEYLTPDICVHFCHFSRVCLVRFRWYVDFYLCIQELNRRRIVVP